MVVTTDSSATSARTTRSRGPLARLGMIVAVCLAVTSLGTASSTSPAAAADPTSYLYCLDGVVLVNNPSVAAMQSTYGQEAYVWLIYGLWRWDTSAGWQFESWSPWKYSTVAGNDNTLGSLYGYGGPGYIDHGTSQAFTQTYFQVKYPGSYYALAIYAYADGAYQSAWGLDHQYGTTHCKT